MASQELLKGNAPTTFSGISRKIQSIVMSSVKFWDKLAMDSGLLDIVNDCLKNGVDVNSVEGNSQKALISFLMSKGASHKDALSYLGVDKNEKE